MCTNVTQMCVTLSNKLLNCAHIAAHLHTYVCDTLFLCSCCCKMSSQTQLRCVLWLICCNMCVLAHESVWLAQQVVLTLSFASDVGPHNVHHKRSYDATSCIMWRMIAHYVQCYAPQCGAIRTHCCACDVMWAHIVHKVCHIVQRVALLCTLVAQYVVWCCVLWHLCS